MIRINQSFILILIISFMLVKSAYCQTNNAINSLNNFSNNLISDHNKITAIENQNKEVQIALNLGSIVRGLRNLAGKGIKNFNKSNSKKILKSGDDNYLPKKYTKLEQSSFNWGFNPNPIAIKNGVRELFENDREGYDEMATWDCPDEIKYGEFMNDISEVYKCVAYQMRCNVVIQNNIDAGSGFFVNSRTIITNYHVIKKNSENIKIIPFTDLKEYKGKVVTCDKNNDLVAIEIEAYGSFNDARASNTFKHCNLSETSPDINSDVLAIGNPNNRPFSLSMGTLEKYLNIDLEKINKDQIDSHYIQHDAEITHGSSGGPLYHKGWIIGVNTGGYNNKSIAINNIKLKKFLDNSEIINGTLYPWWVLSDLPSSSLYSSQDDTTSVTLDISKFGIQNFDTITLHRIEKIVDGKGIDQFPRNEQERKYIKQAIEEKIYISECSF